MTQIYIKPSSNQRSTTSREASAAGRLRPNGIIGDWESSGFTTSNLEARFLAHASQVETGVQNSSETGPEF